MSNESCVGSHLSYDGCKTSLLIPFDVAAHVISDFGEVVLHAFGIASVDDFKQFLELGSYLADLVVGVGVEENLLEQIVVFIKNALCNLHVTFESGAGCILMFHDSREDECRDERYAERIGHGAVVLVEGVLVDVKPESLVEVAEEDAPHVVAFADDDGVLLRELVEVGKGGTKHGMGTHVGMAALLVELVQTRLHGGDVADDTFLGQQRYDLLEDGNGVLQRDGIDDELRLKAADFFQLSESLAVVCEPHALRVAVVDGDFVFKTEQVDEE